MGFFNKILEKLGLGKDKPAPAKTTPAAPAQSGASAPTARPTVVERGEKHDFDKTAAPTKPTPAPMSEVDVVKKLDQLAKGSGLDWKVSIVDLLKLLDIDSSLAARKELAQELGCPPELMGGDSAKMNVWLHKTVLKKIAENGGNIPAELLD